MDAITHIIALSGGKDSTAMALALAEREPRDYTYLITPTGDELPEMLDHWQKLETLLGKPLVRLYGGTLNGLIEQQGALPNWRQRWCTRLLKIKPAIEFYEAHLPAIAYVGLRADEDADERRGLYGTEIEQNYPLRRWGWGLPEVKAYLRERGVTIPARTDCARCYDQQLGEWEMLFWTHRNIWEEAKAQETATGHTFRGPQRDSQPAPLAELEQVFKKRGRPWKQLAMIGDDLEDDERSSCRVCRL